jgi:hypothetical protein
MVYAERLAYFSKGPRMIGSMCLTRICGEPDEFWEENASETASEKCKSRSRYMMRGFRGGTGVPCKDIVTSGARFRAMTARMQSAT